MSRAALPGQRPGAADASQAKTDELRWQSDEGTAVEAVGDPNAPDVVASEDAVVLEELLVLPPERSEALSFPLERPACDHLRERDLLDTYHGLAVILTREAQAPRHPHEQADLALVNSELLSMLGELDTAREYLDALAPVSTPATALQARQLAFCAQDRSSYLQLLKAELRSQISHESRRHLMALYSDVLRMVSEDETEGRRHLELSLRAFPSDPRFLLQRLAGQLGDASGSTRRRLPSVPDLPKLSDALRDLQALRTGNYKIGECAHPAGALIAATRAWEDKDLDRLLNAVDDLRNVDELASGAAWLHACLCAFSPGRRRDGSSLLERLFEQGDSEAELALLERRLHEPSDLPTSVEAFSLATIATLSASDRLALGLAVDAHVDTLRVLAEDAGRDAASRVLAQAVRSADSLSEAPAVADSASGRRSSVGAMIGRLALTPSNRGEAAEDAATSQMPGSRDATPTPLPDAIIAQLRELARIDPDDEVPRSLQWLETLRRCEAAELAPPLLELAPMFAGADRAAIYVLAALLARLSSSNTVEIQALALARTTDPKLECVHRALAAVAAGSNDANSLTLLASATESTERRAILELEERLRRDCEPGQTNSDRSDIIAAVPALLPLARMLEATTNGSTSNLSEFAGAGESLAARSFASLLDGLLLRADPNARGRAAPPACDALPTDDPLANALLTALNFGVAPLDADDALLSASLRSWLAAKELAGQIPGNLDAVTPSKLRAVGTDQPRTGLVDQQAEETASSPIPAHWEVLYHQASGGDAAAFSRHVAAANAATDDAQFIDSILEAIELDPERDSATGSLICAHRVLERAPNHLSALRIALRETATHDSMHATGPFAARLAKQLAPMENQALAWLAITSTTYANDADANIEQAFHLDRLVAEKDSMPIWACRKLMSIAQAKSDDSRFYECVNRLLESTSRALDTATLTLRAAEAASRLERWEDVEQLLEKSVEAYPEHLVALSMRAEFLEARGETARAARAYDALAEAACMPTHKVAAWVQAATLYREADADLESTQRATLALERAVELDQTHGEATSRLRDLYIAQGELLKLEQLLTRQLLRVEGGEERARIEFERAKALIDLNRSEEAEGGLERALSLMPSHEPALVLAARLKEDRGDFEGAEQQLLRLAGLSTDSTTQVTAYLRLAELYQTHLEQPARAELAYREVLAREPAHACADRLVQLLIRLDNPHAAVELLAELAEKSSDLAAQRNYHLELARIHDAVIGDRRRAEEILERTRRRWPNDAATIQALAEFYRRGKDQVALNTLLDRSVVDARRALGQGRFESAFFEVIACVAELRDEPDLGRVARATVAALNAQPSAIDGLGHRAAEEQFGDLLAPEVLSLPIRAMLRKTGWALCSAHPIDVRALRATPLAKADPELSEHLRELARAFGLFEIDLYVSPALGAVCQPTSSVPATLVVGSEFAALKSAPVRDALAIRAFRILSANAAALANTPPVDLWPLLVGYLAAYLPDWLPPAMDAGKIAPIRQRIVAVLPRNTDPDLPHLAADVAASIGNRASQLGIAVQQWGSRTALLALGDPGTVLAGIAAAGGQLERLSASPSERQKWVVRNPEARDLATFSVSAAYLDARAKCLGRE